MRRSPAALLTLCLAGTLSAPPAATAQDVEITTATRVEFSGFLGGVVRLFGGGREVTEKTYIKGARMRTDDGESASIVDLENGRFVTIDHKARTYTVVTLDQMLEAMQQAERQVRAQAAEARREEPAAKEAEVRLRVNVAVDRTNERDRIAGQQAERAFITLTTDAMVTPGEGGPEEEAGRLVLLVDTWNAKDTPADRAMRRFAERVPEATQRRSQGMLEAMAAAFAQDGSLEEGMKKAAEELSKLEGYSMRSVTHFVLVPPGLEFDREVAIAGGGGATRTAGGIARGAARGLLGRAAGARQQEQQREDEPRQASIMKVTTEVRDMKTGTLDAALFEPPAGYREVPFRVDG
jgi:hypothetical protein